MGERRIDRSLKQRCFLVGTSSQGHSPGLGTWSRALTGVFYTNLENCHFSNVTWLNQLQHGPLTAWTGLRWSFVEACWCALNSSLVETTASFGKILVTYAVVSSMLSNFYCVCFAYVIVHTARRWLVGWLQEGIGDCNKRRRSNTSRKRLEGKY